MLKLNYTENGLFMERLAVPLEVLIAQRVLLAVRSRQPLTVQPGRSAFLLPMNVDGLNQLELALRLERTQHIDVTPLDEEYVEISIEGTWLAQDAAAVEGTFITAVSDRTEFFVYKLWQVSQSRVSFLA